MPHPVASGRRLNIYGKPIQAPATAAKVDPATTEFAFPYLRDTAAVQQNAACAGGVAAGCIASFDETSATATVSYEQAGAPGRMLPYVRVPTPITDTSEMTTMVEARSALAPATTAVAPAVAPAVARPTARPAARPAFALRPCTKQVSTFCVRSVSVLCPYVFYQFLCAKAVSTLKAYIVYAWFAYRIHIGFF